MVKVQVNHCWPSAAVFNGSGSLHTSSGEISWVCNTAAETSQSIVLIVFHFNNKFYVLSWIQNRTHACRSWKQSKCKSLLVLLYKTVLLFMRRHWVSLTLEEVSAVDCCKHPVLWCGVKTFITVGDCMSSRSLCSVVWMCFSAPRLTVNKKWRVNYISLPDVLFVFLAQLFNRLIRRMWIWTCFAVQVSGNPFMWHSVASAGTLSPSER